MDNLSSLKYGQTKLLHGKHRSCRCILYSTCTMIDQKYLLFQFKGNLYKYTCLTIDLSSAPRIFTKILKPVFSALRKEGHQIKDYLDDTYLGDTFNECKNAVLANVKLPILGSSESAFTYLKLTIETLEQGVKYVQS